MNKALIDRLCLGTVQFGLNDYGIANKSGKVSEREAFEILEHAYGAGIITLDTAYSYGKSEEIIGRFVSNSGSSFNIISKMPHPSGDDISSIERYCLETLKRLKSPKIHGYLVHNFADITLYKEDLWRRLESLKQRGLVDKIGVSLYKPGELEYLLKSGFSFDIVQIPYSIFDQRFKRYFSILRKQNVEIHVRSVFLQGLFFADTEKIKKKIKKDFQQLVRDRIERLRDISAEHDIPVHSLCLCFVLLTSLIDKIIIGVDSLHQLKLNISSLEDAGKVESLYERLESLELQEEEVVLPYNWKR